MNKGSMKMASIVLMVLGAGLAFWGYQMSGGFGSKVSLAITGSHSDKVMMLYIGGAVSFFAGLFLAKK
jgi:hypothetical protein